MKCAACRGVLFEAVAAGFRPWLLMTIGLGEASSRARLQDVRVVRCPDALAVLGSAFGGSRGQRREEGRRRSAAQLDSLFFEKILFFFRST